jgi:hypothetical protein
MNDLALVIDIKTLRIHFKQLSYYFVWIRTVLKREQIYKNMFPFFN